MGHGGRLGLSRSHIQDHGWTPVFFALTGQLTLVQRCRTRNGRHDFVMHSRVPGPNVFLDGWADAQMMFWNSSADSITCESPPTARNWGVGSSAGSYSGNCYWYSVGKAMEPRSLYLKKLEERLGSN